MIETVASNAPPKIRPYVMSAAPFIAAVIVGIQVSMPFVMKAIATVTKLVNAMPDKIFWATIGFLMCFFGGTFPATIAAAEAWQLCGGAEAIQNVKELWQQATKAHEANEADDDRDDDNDGVKDVDQISGKELVARKASLIMKTIDPVACNAALSQLYIGWIAVVAVLKIKFAKTVTLGEAIGGQLYNTASHLFEPMLTSLTPEDYKSWTPIVLKWACKVVAISLAWWIQRLISAFHSAVRGGLMFGRYVVNYAHEKGYLAGTDQDTYIDEMLGWVIAFCGFAFQFMMGFRLPFVLSVFLLPVSILEWFIEWSVASNSSPTL